MNETIEDIDRVRDHLVARFGPEPPQWIITLGSALGPVKAAIDCVEEVPYSELGVPVPTTKGHAGKLGVGRVGRHRVVCMSGRLHLYEGYSPFEAMLLLRALRRWDPAQHTEMKVILTAAGGAIARDLASGDVVLVRDHINFSGANALRGAHLPELRRDNFVDLTRLYDPALRALTQATARSLGRELREAVYACTSGPSYETPAEVRALGLLGADVTGMSLSHDATVARHAGLRVLGFCVVSNLAAGISGDEISHEEVVSSVAGAADWLAELVRHLLEHA